MHPIKLLYFYADSDQQARTFLITVEAFAEKYDLEMTAVTTSRNDFFEKYSVSFLPTTVFLRAEHEVGRVVGTDIKKLRETYEGMLNQKSLTDRLNALITSSSLMIFIKGSPEAPKCGFTRQLLDLFRQYKVADFGYFDILSDESVRQGNRGWLSFLGLKELSSWPTYPQIYLDGELIGGLDIVRENLTRDGKLKV